MDSTQVVVGLGELAQYSGDFAMYAGILIAMVVGWVAKAPKVKVAASVVVAFLASIVFQYAATGMVTFPVVWALAKVALGYTGVTTMGMSATGTDEKMAKTDWRGRPR